MKDNDLNVFLETGCTKKPPKIFNSKWEVCENNPAKEEIKINQNYIHNGKGTAIIKRIETRTQLTKI